MITMNPVHYSTTDPAFWTGRIDDPTDRDSFRMHQIITLINLSTISTIQLNSNSINICFIGFRCDEGVKRNLGRPGAERGPEYIRKEFANLPVTFTESIQLYDAGDIYCVDGNMEVAQDDLARAVTIILNNAMFPIVLGGGHELSLGNYTGIMDFLKTTTPESSLGIINFDAHFDLRPYKEHGSSGTMFSQIADQCKNNNKPFNYMCLGIQTYGNTISLFKRADALGVKYILSKDITDTTLDTISRDIALFTEQHSHLYVTLCSDVFSSAFAPGVSALQPFGMHPEVFLRFFKEIVKTEKVISFDVAEVSPRFDQDNHTAKLIAIILYALINTMKES